MQVSLNEADGQAFAALAQDPALRRPEVFRQGPAEAAYRAQRPVLGWLAWLASAGRTELVPEALYGVTLLSMAVFALGAASLAARFGRSTLVVWAVALLPGAIVTVQRTGPELLATAAAMVAVGEWSRFDEVNRRGSRAVVVAAALVVSVLCRETMLVVAAVMGLHALWNRGLTARRASALLCAPLVYVFWVGVVRTRYGAWPEGAVADRVSLPFVGLADAAADWQMTDVLCAATGVVLLVMALVRGRRELPTFVAMGFAALATVLGPAVWADWRDWSRVLLPMFAFSAVMALPGGTASSNMRSPVTPNL
jgi:hypothetical protein